MGRLSYNNLSHSLGTDKMSIFISNQLHLCDLKVMVPGFYRNPNTQKGERSLMFQEMGRMKKCVYSECRDCIDTWKGIQDYQTPLKIMFSSCRYGNMEF